MKTVSTGRNMRTLPAATRRAEAGNRLLRDSPPPPKTTTGKTTMIPPDGTLRQEPDAPPDHPHPLRSKTTIGTTTTISPREILPARKLPL